MSEPDAAAPADAPTPPVADPTPAPPPAPQVHGGEMLRQAREATGLHVAALAVALKVPVRQIEALEAGAFDRLPDATFVRALAGSVCRHLHLDPRPILAQLPESRPQAPRGDSGINEPFQRPGDGARASLPEVLRRPAVLIALVLLLGAVLLMMLPSLWHRGEATGTASPNATSPEATVAAEPASAPVAVPAATSALPGASMPTAGGRGLVIENVQPAVPLPPAVGTVPPARTAP